MLGIAAAGLIVAGIIAVGNAARDSLGQHDRYLLPFHDIECAAPPGHDRSSFSTRCSITANCRIRSMFSIRHCPIACVRRSIGMAASSASTKVLVLPPRRVQVELLFRQ